MKRVKSFFGKTKDCSFYIFPPAQEGICIRLWCKANRDQISSIKDTKILLRRSVSQEDGPKFLPLVHIRDTSPGDSSLVLPTYQLSNISSGQPTIWKNDILARPMFSIFIYNDQKSQILGTSPHMQIWLSMCRLEQHWKYAYPQPQAAALILKSNPKVKI